MLRQQTAAVCISGFVGGDACVGVVASESVSHITRSCAVSLVLVDSPLIHGYSAGLDSGHAACRSVARLRRPRAGGKATNISGM